MTEAYPHRLREKAHQAAGALGFACKEGVYAIFPGPCYETAAEIRAYEHLGADAIGMSTVPEVIAANYLGMAVLGIACITNMATGIAREKHSHQEVLRIANESSPEALCAGRARRARAVTQKRPPGGMAFSFYFSLTRSSSTSGRA